MSARSCSRCHKPGHYAPRCPERTPAPRPPQPAPSPLISFVEHPAPEPAPPTLTDWRPPPAEYVRARDPGRSRVLEVRLDQHGRVRAQISKITDDDSDWVYWETFDCTGQRVDKPGIDGALRTARDRVDRRLVRFGWLSVDRIGASASGVAAPVVLEPSAVAVLRRAAEQMVAPISRDEWRRRVAVMLRIARAFGDRAWIVAPDRVGHQQETLARLAAFARPMRTARRLGARVIVPIQLGAMAPAAFDRTAAEILGFDDFSRGIPGNKVAMPVHVLEAFLRERRATAVHLLGMGPRNARYQAMVDVLRRFVPGAEVTCDSNAFSAVTGRTNGADDGPRMLTNWQDHFEGRPNPVAECTVGDPRQEQSREAAVVMTFGPGVWFARLTAALARQGVYLDGFERVGDGRGVAGFEPPQPRERPLQVGLFDQVGEGGGGGE